MQWSAKVILEGMPTIEMPTQRVAQTLVNGCQQRVCGHKGQKRPEKKKGRYGLALTASLGVLAVTGVCNGQGFVVVDNAVVEAQVVLGSGLVGACGIRVTAKHSIGLQAVRTWDVTLYMGRQESPGIAVDASSYDVERVGAQREVRPAPTELSFTIKGTTRAFTAAAFRSSQTTGASLALISEKGAGQILTAFGTGVPVVVFFRPAGAETEAVVVSGKAAPHTAETFGQCIQYLRGAKTGESWPEGDSLD
jgi:hypothetical protein